MRLILLLIAVIFVAVMMNSYIGSPDGEQAQEIEAKKEEAVKAQQELQKALQEAQENMQKMSEAMQRQQQELQRYGTPQR